MARNYVKENVPLSRFGVLVAQLESIVASATHKPPEPLLCFDLLSDLISAIDEEPKDSILLWQRKCEDALFSLLVLGARRPVRHLASLAMANIIMKGDSISIYSRASSLRGFLSEGKKSEPYRVADIDMGSAIPDSLATIIGAALCLGELYRYFGRRITSGLLETTHIVTKLLKFNEDFVRQEALQLLQNALEGSGGNAASPAYVEAFRVITRIAVGDKSFIVRKAAARCLKTFANIGGPGLGIGEFETSSSLCVKALEDPVSSVRDSFAEALGALLALGMNPDAQLPAKGKGQFTPKKFEGGLQKHLSLPFMKATGLRMTELRVGITLSWVSFFQAIRLRYHQPDGELQNFAVQVIDMLHTDNTVDAQALACVLYILRVGVTDQMSEPTQRNLLVFLGKQLQLSSATPSMRIASLRTVSYTLKSLGEVPQEFKEVLDDTIVASLSHHSPLVRVEAALTLRTLVEVDPSCAGGLISYAVTMLAAARENVAFDKGNNIKFELECLHGEAAVLAALVSISPKLPLGYPSRLPRSVLEVSKKMLMDSSRNPAAAAVEKEAGWTLLSSLLSSIPKEELEDQVFDILSLWAASFNGTQDIRQREDLNHSVSVWSAAIDALSAFIKCFVSTNGAKKGILLEPVLLYLSRALSYTSLFAYEGQENVRAAMDVLIIRILIAYQSLSDPSAYKSDHHRIIQICTAPFRDASKFEESSCLTLLLDKRDAPLGPWTPGRDWFEDELRSFQGGKDGVLPCLWEYEAPSFPQPETVSKMLVNQMLLCFGTMFASQDSSGMLSLLGMIEQCLKSGKKQAWRVASVTNICVGLLSGLKALLALRPEPLGLEILTAAQSIFQSILAEGDILASQRRASSEGLGLLARLGNDIFAARLTKSLLSEVSGATDVHYTGSIALALGGIHRSAGGMALSSLVPATVNTISALAKSSVTNLQLWALHGLLLTIEAAGLSYVSQVQATLALALDILLSEESGLVDLQQGVGRLINAIVAVLGPELSPGSIFFSRCKSVIAEISSNEETATLLESVRFTQQLVLFAPQAVTVQSQVQTLLPTLSSRQPTLRRLALSTLRHLIEKNLVSIAGERIEEGLFHMLDEETDIEIANLARTTIMRLLYASCSSCPSHWLSICKHMILASSRRDVGGDSMGKNSSTGLSGEATLNLGEDDENMVSTSRTVPGQVLDYPGVNSARDKHLRYRTRVFAAECLSHLPGAVGNDSAHFDLSVARAHAGDWLIFQLQDLISLAYQISTIHFENMRPIGMELLSTIVDKVSSENVQITSSVFMSFCHLLRMSFMNLINSEDDIYDNCLLAILPYLSLFWKCKPLIQKKFERVADPDLSGHLLLEQYQAQLLSAVRTALDPLSGPILLEAGLRLATKLLTSGILSQDQAAVKRIFSLISRPLDDFNDLYYPSFAEWVSSKIKIRLLTAHASLKCYIYGFLKREENKIPDEYQALLPLFAKNSEILGLYWISVLKDYSVIRFRSNPRKNWKPFLDGIQSSLVSSKLQPCLEEAWPVILQAVVFDAAPEKSFSNESPVAENRSKSSFISGFRMVELGIEEFHFLWGFSLLVLFQGQDIDGDDLVILVGAMKPKFIGDLTIKEESSSVSKLLETVLPVLEFLCVDRFFSAGFLTIDSCKELLQVFLYSLLMGITWDSSAVSVVSKILQNCPNHFLESENFSHLASELCLAFLFKRLVSSNATSGYHSGREHIIFVSLSAAATLLRRIARKIQLKSLLPFLLIGNKSVGVASTELYLSRANEFFQSIISLLKVIIDDKPEIDGDGICELKTISRACITSSTSLITDCIERLHLLEDKRSNQRTLLQMKLSVSLEYLSSFAKIAFELDCPGEGQEFSSELSTSLRVSTECIRSVLNDYSIQVQVIGLQVLKTILQKGNSTGYNSFEIFFVGELVRDIVTLIHKHLESPANRESGTVVGECLKMLVLLQALSRASECRKGLLNLLLEAILMAFSMSNNCLSQELNGLKGTAISLVSQLAQSPNSAVLFRDVLLTMPVERRQKLQDIIRASITQDQNITEKPSAVALAIKIPAPIEERKEQGSSLPQVREVDESVADEEEEEDDDWDTFQSFPASTNEAENPSISNHDHELLSDSTPLDEAAELTEKPSVVSSAIKIHAPVEERKEHSSSSHQVREFHGIVEDAEDEEDDVWDTFQSLPASTNEAAPASISTEEPSLTEKPSTSNHDHQLDSDSPPLDAVEVISAANEEAAEVEIASDSEKSDQLENDEVVPTQANVEATIHPEEVQGTSSEPFVVAEEMRLPLDSEKNTSSSDGQRVKGSSDPDAEYHSSSAAGSGNEKEMESI